MHLYLVLIMPWFRWALALLILVYGLLTYDRESISWGVAGLLLYVVPLALQATRRVLARTYALWLGIFLMVQSLLSFYFIDNFVSLSPHLRLTVKISATDIPGIFPGTRHISTDALGFRATPTVDYLHKRGYRIFAIGGSTTEEIMLDDHSTWPYLLQQRLQQPGQPVEVINTGVSGLRASNHLATLRNILPYQPDLVIFLMGANDWNQQIKNHFEWRNHLPPVLRYTLVGKAVQQLVIFPLKSLWIKDRPQQKTMHIASMADYSNPRKSLFKAIQHRYHPSDVAVNYAETLGKISRLCHENKVPCLFMTQPSGYHPAASPAFQESFWMTPPYASYTLDIESMAHIAALYNRHMLDFARQAGHPSCDIAPGVAASYAHFFDDMHYNETGAQRVAELVAPCVQTIMALK